VANSTLDNLQPGRMRALSALLEGEHSKASAGGRTEAFQGCANYKLLWSRANGYFGY